MEKFPDVCLKKSNYMGTCFPPLDQKSTTVYYAHVLCKKFFNNLRGCEVVRAITLHSVDQGLIPLSTHSNSFKKDMHNFPA